MAILLITNCSNRKFGRASERVSASDLSSGSIPQLCSSWQSMIKNSELSHTVGSLYCGRAFREARLASDILKADHWVVSAGLGLVHIDKKVPPYDLTISGSGDTSISQKFNGSSFDPTMWWTELNKKNEHQSVCGLIASRPQDLVIIAMPTSYFSMIMTDLATLNPFDLTRIRLIGPNSKYFPAALDNYRLPYDDRLDGKDSPIPGTRSDFPQRAVHHFSKYVLQESRYYTAKEHAELTLSKLSSWGRPIIPARVKKSDNEIKELIRKNWKRANGQSSKMLRLIRSDELVQCEQKRFQKIFHAVKT